MWAKAFKWTLPAFDSWQEFSSGLWGQAELGLVDPEIAQEKAFSQVEKSYIQKASDCFSEFCHQSYPEIFYAKEKELEDVPLQCDVSYSFQDGREWHDVSLRKLSVNGEGNLFTEWMGGFTGS